MDDTEIALPLTSRQHYEKALAETRKEVEKQGVMITILRGWLDVYRSGYSALVSYGIDFMSLKVYKEEYPHGADDLPLLHARSKYARWFGRIETNIAAAIRRKQFKVHENHDVGGPEGN